MSRANRGRAIGLIVAGCVLLLGAFVASFFVFRVGFGTLAGSEPDAVVGGELAVEVEEAGTDWSLYHTFRSPSDCRVDGPGGPVELRDVSPPETLEIGGDTYIAQERWTAEEAGTHVVSCPTSGVSVGPAVDLLRFIGGTFGFFIVLGLGVPLGVVPIYFGVRQLRARPQGAFTEELGRYGPRPSSGSGGPQPPGGPPPPSGPS